MRGLNTSATIRGLDDFFPQTDNPVEEGERSGKGFCLYCTLYTVLRHAPPPTRTHRPAVAGQRTEAQEQ